MRVLMVVLFACWDRDGQTIFFGCKRAGGVRRDGAWGTVRAIEVKDDGAVYYRVCIEKTSAGVRIALSGEVVEDKEKALGGIAA